MTGIRISFSLETYTHTANASGSDVIQIELEAN